MVRLIVSLSLIGSFLVVLPVESRARDKCWLISSRKKGRVKCKYTWKKKRSKLRRWATNWCRNTGIGNHIKDNRYYRCNKKGTKCREINTTCY